MQMIAERNAPEVTQLYQDTVEELRQFLVRKIGDTEQADEIAQHTYLKLCRLKFHRDIRNPRCYLFNIAVRLAINVLDKRRLTRQRVFQCNKTSRDTLAHLVLVDELETEAIKDSILELSDKTRYVFLLHRYRGLSFNAIAKHLAVSVNAIENQMDLALSSIQCAASEFRMMGDRPRYSH